MTAANRIILDYKLHSGAVARYFDVVVCSCWSMVTYFVGIMQRHHLLVAILTAATPDLLIGAVAQVAELVDALASGASDQ